MKIKFNFFLALVWGIMASSAFSVTGSWRILQNQPGEAIGHMLLLSDGTVMAQGFGNATWYRLTPVNGSYENGQWSTSSSSDSIANMQYTRTYYSSQILTDGRVFVAGAEYGTGGSTAEVYEPKTNNWTTLSVPAGFIQTGTASDGNNAGFRDSVSAILGNGNVLVAPVFYRDALGTVSQNGTLIYNPKTNAWSRGPLAFGSQNEASWVKLPDGTILTIDKNTTNSERYNPVSNTWISDNPLPPGVVLYASNSEIGAGVLLSSGKVIFLGATGQTAIYTPTGSTAQGSWVQGPNLPNVTVLPGNSVQGVNADAPAAMMVNGKVLCAISAAANHQPVFFCEYDPTPTLNNPNGFFTPVASPTDNSNTAGSPDNTTISDATDMLALPDGTILYSHTTSQLYVYVPNPASPLAQGKPAISSITTNSDGSYYLAGTGLNGISEGATYGDESQASTNYPLVRLTSSGGNIIYARTYNWSSTGVQTGNTPVSTEFTLPADVLEVGGGTYSLVVVANGISSDPVTFTSPVWVDFTNFIPFIQLGTQSFPYATLSQAVAAVPVGGSIFLKGPRTSSQTFTAPPISKAMTIVAIGGAATVGQQ